MRLCFQTGKKMNNNNPNLKNEPKLRQVLKEDFKQINLRKDLRREYRSMGEFYLNEEKKNRLKNMPRFKREIYRSVWLFQSMFLRLTPLRRMLVLIGMILFVFTGSGRSDGEGIQINSNGMLSGFLFLFVLLLELKDKLVMQTELEGGRKVQQSLMPEQNPSFPGWELWLHTSPANQVGGDLVDYFRVSDQKALITIADISGKELQAALLMTKLQATIRALLGTNDSLCDFASRINKIFHRDIPSSSFASLIYTEVNGQDGQLRYINAGHFPPLIIKPNAIEIAPRGGPAIGLMSNVDYVEQLISLQPGEMYLAYTDGVIEARNERGEFYGMERFLELLEVIKVLPINEIGQRITGSVKWFADDAPVSDDISVVILKKV